jgi:hypothetical protein
VPTAKQKKVKPVPGPDDLVRRTAGEYQTGDDRFVVRQSDSNWYVVDTEQTNEFGQELIHGPFPNLKQARGQISAARTVKPLLRSTVRPKTSRKAAAPPPDEPKPKPQTWIDKLPAAEASEVRRLIRALERQGIADADGLVRKDRGGLLPAVATALLQRRLEELIDALPETDRRGARALADRIADLLTSTDRLPDPLPGWALFETGAGREPTKRRIRLGEDARS